MISGAGKSDIRNATNLVSVVESIKSTGSQSQLFEPTIRESPAFPGANPIENLYKYAYRRYEYDADGNFTALYLHQQSGLGPGIRFSRDQVLGAGYNSSSVLRGNLIRDSSSKATATTIPTPPGNPGRQHKKKRKADENPKKRKRDEPKTVRRKIKELVTEVHDASMASAGKIGIYSCADTDGGDPNCSANFKYKKCLMKHIQKGVHCGGPISSSYRRSAFPFKMNGLTTRDCMIHEIAGRTKTQRRTSVDGNNQGVTGAGQLSPIELVDGSQYNYTTRKMGWACTKRLPPRKLSSDQTEFVVQCFLIGQKDKARKVNPTDAVILMKELGTLEAEKKQPHNSYFKANATATPVFSRVDILDADIFKNHFGKKPTEITKMSSELEKRTTRNQTKVIAALTKLRGNVKNTSKWTLDTMNVLVSYYNTGEIAKFTKSDRAEGESRLQAVINTRGFAMEINIDLEIDRLRTSNIRVDSATAREVSGNERNSVVPMISNPTTLTPSTGDSVASNQPSGVIHGNSDDTYTSNATNRSSLAFHMNQHFGTPARFSTGACAVPQYPLLSQHPGLRMDHVHNARVYTTPEYHARHTLNHDHTVTSHFTNHK